MFMQNLDKLVYLIPLAAIVYTGARIYDYSLIDSGLFVSGVFLIIYSFIIMFAFIIEWMSTQNESSHSFLFVTYLFTIFGSLILFLILAIFWISFLIMPLFEICFRHFLMMN